MKTWAKMAASEKRSSSPPGQDGGARPGISGKPSGRSDIGSIAQPPRRLLAHAAMMLFALLIAFSFSLGALAAPHIGPAALNAMRFLIGVTVMAAVARSLLGRPLTLPGAPWRFLVLGALMGIYFVTMFIALKIAHPVSTGAVFTLMPLMSAGFGILILGQRVSLVMLVSLLLAAAGSVWVIFRGDIERLLAFEVGLGEAIFFVGCIAHAAYAPLVKRLNRDEPLLLFSFWTLTATGGLISLYGIQEIVDTEWTALPFVVWLAIGYLAIFTTAGTFFLLQFGSMHLPASKVLAYGYLTPCFIILIEGALGHGWVSPSVFAGALVVVLGLLVLMLAPER